MLVNSRDVLTALAFDRRKNPTGSRLNAVYSSDIGHWALPDVRDGAHEAYELVEDGLTDEQDSRDFVFINPARMNAEVNPDFFKHTRLTDVARLLSERKRESRIEELKTRDS
jgi:hypothetical protein